jgi:hypothetical protein
VHAEAVRRGLIQEEPARAGGGVGAVGEGMAGSAGGVGRGEGMAGSAGGEGPASSRPLVKRTWTAEEAEEWTREDWIVIVLSPMVMAFFMVGVASLLLLRPGGILLTAAALFGSGLIYWVIDPKLRAVSAEYEQRQARYLAELERGVRWEEERGAVQAQPIGPASAGREV